MSLSRKKIEKRKARQKAVRKKILAQREELRKERKLIEVEKQQELERWKLEHGATQEALPGNPELAAKKEARKAQEVANKLQRNIEILKALEAEYDAEQLNRKNLNDKLESEGYNSMKDKMAALQEKALRMKEVADMQALAATEKAEESSAGKKKS